MTLYNQNLNINCIFRKTRKINFRLPGYFCLKTKKKPCLVQTNLCGFLWRGRSLDLLELRSVHQAYYYLVLKWLNGQDSFLIIWVLNSLTWPLREKLRTFCTLDLVDYASCDSVKLIQKTISNENFTENLEPPFKYW